MSWRHREPRLEDMLADSIVKAVMEADGVDPRELETIFRHIAAHLWAIKARSEPNPAVHENRVVHQSQDR